MGRTLAVVYAVAACACACGFAVAPVPAGQLAGGPSSANGGGDDQANGSGDDQGGARGGASAELDAGSALVTGGGDCPDRGDAAACPSLFGYPAGWVGCSNSSVTGGLVTTCTCIGVDGGVAWLCETTDVVPLADAAISE